MVRDRFRCYQFTSVKVLYLIDVILWIKKFPKPCYCSRLVLIRKIREKKRRIMNHNQFLVRIDGCFCGRSRNFLRLYNSISTSTDSKLLHGSYGNLLSQKFCGFVNNFGEYSNSTTTDHLTTNEAEKARSFSNTN